MALSHKGQRSRLGSFRVLADGRIRVTVAHGYTLSGSPRRVTGYADTMEEAERLALQLSADLGRRPDLGHGLTLGRWWDAYSVGKGKRLARATLERYGVDMRHVWLPVLGRTDISLITRQQVQEVILSLPTKSRAQHALRTLSAVLTQAVRDGYLGTNPIRSGGFELPGDVGALDPEGLPFSLDDPFGAIEDTQNVWDAMTVLEAMPIMRGVPLETCWLCMVGAGLRREEALALEWRDVRRVMVGDRPVTQIAVYKALTARDGLKRTKTKGSVRIVAVVEPFGERLWELRGEPDEIVVKISVSNIQKRWKNMFVPITSKHAPTEGCWKGRLAGFPYIPLNRMRATHETFMQQAGVLDSVNAATHGHSERVSYSNYQRPDGIDAARRAGDFLVLQGAKARRRASGA